MTANDIRRALFLHFSQRWVLLPEVTARAAVWPEKDRRIDMLMLKPIKAGWERLAVEIKVTRADFLSDVRCPEKQAPWRALAHRHAYAVPEGLVTLDEVPSGSGLIVVGPLDGRYINSGRPVRFERRCPAGNNPGGALPDALVKDALYRAMRGEALRAGYGRRDLGPDADPDELLSRIGRLEHELRLAHSATENAREVAAKWRRRYGQHEPPPCGTCGHPLHPGKRDKYTGWDGWQHRDPNISAACLAGRVAAARAVAEADAARTGERANDWMWSEYHIGGPQPAEQDPESATPAGSPVG